MLRFFTIGLATIWEFTPQCGQVNASEFIDGGTYESDI